VVCYELTDGQQNTIMDSTDDGFIAATGSIHGAVLDADPGANRRANAIRPTFLPR
jgi:hypothetical protein